MATVHLFGPYWVLRLPEDKFKPGETGVFGFGPWPQFQDGTVSVSATPWDFSSIPTGGSREITVDSISYSLSSQTERFIRFIYRNTGSEPMQGWYFTLSVVLP